MAKEYMPDGTSPETGAVTVVDPAKEIAPPKRGILGRIFGEGSQPQVLVDSGEYRPIASQEPPSNEEQRQGLQISEGDNGENNQLNADQGGVDGGGIDNGDDGGERARGPERGPEWETSPERGRMLVDELIRLRTEFTYKQRYSMTLEDVLNSGAISDYLRDYLQENSTIYNGESAYITQLYNDIQKYVNKVCEVRNDPNAFRPEHAYPRSTQTIAGQLLPPEFPPLDEAMLRMHQIAEGFRRQYMLEGVEEAEDAGYSDEALPTDQGRDIDTRKSQYAQSKDPAEVEAAKKDLAVYFRQAKNRGLLKEVDATLNLLYEEINVYTSQPGQAFRQLEALRNRINGIRQIADIEYQERKLADPTIPDELENVGEAYLDWAERRLARYITGQPDLDTEAGEWVLPNPDQSDSKQKDTFWELGHYPKLYVITAKTEPQFLIAKDTFLKMVKSGAIGESATAIYEHVQNFIAQFEGEGGRQVGRGNISLDFLKQNRMELEAFLYVFVANYAGEVYQPKQKKDAMIAMSLDTGPERWAALYRGGEGEIAAFSHMFDYEILMDILINSVGERGELDTIAGQFLEHQIQEIAIERGMGIILKDYDPRDGFLNEDSLEAKIYAAYDLERINKELRQINEDISRGRIKLKEGETALDRLGFGNMNPTEASAEIQAKHAHDVARYKVSKENLRMLALVDGEDRFKRLYEGFDKGDAHIKNYQRYVADLSKPEDQRQFPPLTDPNFPERIKRSIDLGRIQVQFQAFRQAILRGQLDGNMEAIEYLSPRDRAIYREANSETRDNFEIVFQMLGVLGEKARRGRGFVYVERNSYIQTYYKISAQIRSDWLDKEKTKVLNTDALDAEEINELINNPDKITDNRIKQIIQNLPQDYKTEFKIGWMLYKLTKDGKGLNYFPGEFRTLYKGLTAEQREVFVDNIPTYQAENFVQWGVFWTKMKYAEAKAPVRRQKIREARTRLVEQLWTKGYEAQLLDEDGKPMTFKRPLGMIDNKTGLFRKFQNNELLGYNQAGQEVHLTFDANGYPTGLDFDDRGEAIIYDKADPDSRQRRNYGNINQNTRASLVEDTLVEEAVSTFEFAAQGSDFRKEYTDDTYWYYQSNNKHTILTPEVTEAAWRIWKGLSRPEDEDILARIRIIVDPTMRRIKKFDDSQQNRETSLIASAVLESFQDRQRTRHAVYRAFLPKDGYVARMQMGYRKEDWSGEDRFTFGFVEFAAQQTARLARRFGANLAITPLEHDAAGPRWGVHGISGAVKLLADPIKNISGQGIKSQFGLTKIFNVMDKAVEMVKHLAGYVDEQTGEWIFGAYEKPTDNNETMHEFTPGAIAKSLMEPEHAIPFLYKFKECFNRVQKVTHDMRVMYSATDNSAGAINIEDHEAFFTDGSFNTEIETDPNIRRNNGTARNRQEAFLEGEENQQGYYDWLIDESPGGGADVYRSEAYWNDYLNMQYKILHKGDEGPRLYQKVRYWLTDKII